jgi:hypothetical protein
MRMWWKNRVVISEETQRWLDKHSNDHYAWPVSTLDELSPELRTAFREALEPAEPVECMIYAPCQGLLRRTTDRKFHLLLPWQFTPDWVLAVTSRRVLLAKAGAITASQIISIPLQDIIYLKVGFVLLFSWIELHWADSDGVHQQTIYYNSVSECLFDNLSLKIRNQTQHLLATRSFEHAPAVPNAEYFRRLPYKFQNLIARRMLLSDEQISAVLFRTVVRKTFLGVFRSRQLPQAALIFTDRHLLIAEEHLTDREESYGLNNTFIPIGRIQRLETEIEGDMLSLIISLSHCGSTTTINLSFPIEMRERLLDFARHFPGRDDL